MSKNVHTFCRICSPLCPLVAEVGDDGEITALYPDREHPVSKGFACHKGLSYLDIHHDPDRLNTPLHRTNPRTEAIGKFEPVSWDQAFQDIGARLRAIRDAHGLDAIAAYGGNPISFNSKAFMPAFTLIARFGGRRSFNAGTQDMCNKIAATEAVFGSLVFPIPDFYHSKYLLCFGSNPKISHGVLFSTGNPMHLLEDIASRGGKVRFVNPRRIESAGPGVDDVIQIKPDTDVYFIAALLNEIEANGGFKQEVIARHGKHIDGLKKFISGYSPDRVADVVGVDAEVIRTVAREFMEADGAATHMATGLNQGRQGTLASWLLHMLSFVTGNLGCNGGEYYAKGYAPSIMSFPNPEEAIIDTELGKMRHVFGALPGNLLADFIELDENPVRALIVFSGNPILSIGGEKRLRKAFPKLELIVAVDIYRNATGEYADYLLPAADWLEREDVNAVSNGVQPTPYAQHTDAVVAPHFERRDDWWIVARLEQELGMPSLLDREFPNPMATDEAMLACSSLSIAALRRLPHHTALLPQSDRKNFYSEAVLTPDKKVDCCPPSFAAALERCEQIFMELADENPDQLKLISLRTNYMHNGNLANMKSLKRGKHAVNPLHIHPLDAERRSLAEGDIAEVFNTNGRVVTPVTYDATLRPGVVALAHGYGHVNTPGLSLANAAPGVNYNRLLPTGPGSYERLSNMSHMTGVPVEVKQFREYEAQL